MRMLAADVMAMISSRTLMMAIQAVDAKVKNLSAQIDQADEDDVSDLEDALLAYTKAADDLRDAYEVALRLSSNLPAYEKLVR